MEMKVLFLILLLGILGWMVHERQFERAVLKKAERVNESNLPPDSETIATTALSPAPPHLLARVDALPVEWRVISI